MPSRSIRLLLIVLVGLLCSTYFLPLASGQQPVPVINQLESSPAYKSALLSLSDPSKLATLGERGANPRLKKIVYWLYEARTAGQDPSQVIDEVLQANGYTPAHAALVKTNLLRNMKIGDELGFFTPENLERLRRGNAPIVKNGPYAGDEGEVDHVIPVSLVPEIGNDLSNLELLPGILNRKKSAKVGQRQKALARDLHAAGVIDEAVLQRILNVKTSDIVGEAAAPAEAQTTSPAPTPALSATSYAPPPSPAAATAAKEVVVWVNIPSHIYHLPGSHWYGNTMHGKYMKEEDAIREGDRASLNSR